MNGHHYSNKVTYYSLLDTLSESNIISLLISSCQKYFVTLHPFSSKFRNERAAKDCHGFSTTCGPSRSFVITAEAICDPDPVGICHVSYLYRKNSTDCRQLYFAKQRSCDNSPMQFAVIWGFTCPTSVSVTRKLNDDGI